MPLVALRLPTKLSTAAPTLVETLARNTNRFTSNVSCYTTLITCTQKLESFTFDAYETLRDLVALRFSSDGDNSGGGGGGGGGGVGGDGGDGGGQLAVHFASLVGAERVGISLFENVPRERDCVYAKVPVRRRSSCKKNRRSICSAKFLRLHGDNERFSGYKRRCSGFLLLFFMPPTWAHNKHK